MTIVDDDLMDAEAADGAAGSARPHRRRRPRGWAWLVVALVGLASLAVAAAGSNDPSTPEDRARSLASTIRCPTCRGQSVLESDAATARSIRDEIGRRIAAGETDDQIRAYLVSVHGETVLLTPPGTGFAGLVWVLPIAGIGVAAGGVALSVTRSRRRPDGPGAGVDDTDPTSTELVGTPSSRRRRLAVLAGAGVVAVGIGIGVAAASGERAPLDTATGSIRDTNNNRLAEARLLVAQGDAVGAIERYDEVLAADPDQREALAYKGWLLVLAGLEDEGLELLDRAIEVDDDYVDARYFRAFVRFRVQGDAASAMEDVRVFLANDPPPDLVPDIADLVADIDAVVNPDEPADDAAQDGGGGR